MTKRTLSILLAVLGVAASVILFILAAVPSVLGEPDRQDATAQQQTIDAVISDRFTQTAAVVGVATQTVAFEQTLEAAFSQAMTATAQAGAIQQPAGRALEPITPDNAARLSEILTLNPGSTVTHVVFAPDNANVFTASTDFVVQQWEIATGAQIRQFVGHADAITDMVISPDGTLLVTSSLDNTIRVWDPATGEEIQAIGTGENPITSLAFIDAARLITGKATGVVALWEMPGLTQIRRIEGHTGPVNAVAFRPPNGRTIGSVGDDGLARLWETNSGRAVRNVGEETTPLTGLAFSPDGETIAVTGQSIAPKLWSATGTIELGTPDNYADIAFSPDGKVVITASWVSPGLRVWNPTTGQEWTQRGMAAPVYDAAFSPDGTMIITGGDAPVLWGVLPGVIPTPAPTLTPSATPTPIPVETQMALEATVIQQTAVIQQETQAALVTPTPRPEGFPTDVRAELQIVQQSFERGWMFWLRHNQQVWVAELDKSGIYGGNWSCYYDTFQEGDPEVDSSLVPPEGLIQPHRGFGKVWRAQPTIREALGWATTPEFELVSAYTYLAGGYFDANGAYVPGPGEHRITLFDGQSFSFFEQTIRGDCIGGTWHVTR